MILIYFFLQQFQINRNPIFKKERIKFQHICYEKCQNNTEYKKKNIKKKSFFSKAKNKKKIIGIKFEENVTQKDRNKIIYK